MKRHEEKFVAPAMVLGSVLLALGTGSALLGPMWKLEIGQWVRVAGLASMFVGVAFLGFATIVRQAAGQLGRRAEFWRFAPIVGFAVGAGIGETVLRNSFPTNMLGAAVGLVLYWGAYRRGGAA